MIKIENTRCPPHQEPRTIDYIGMVFKDWLQNVRYFCWIVLQVRVLNDDDLASAPLESRLERRGFAAIFLMYRTNTGIIARKRVNDFGTAVR